MPQPADARRVPSEPAEHRLKSRPVARRQQPRLFQPAVARHAARKCPELGVERPEELVVYGGIGRAARNWEAFDQIVDVLKRLDDNQ
ncbi:MAG TPA: hypothetical protein H9899_11720, partial [Candidatus Sphingomonas excrementigallinarum]|nr:hypothetical protein [Candidatus Sphingomonas excrementigallinarum]